jgi:hypothetical protein
MAATYVIESNTVKYLSHFFFSPVEQTTEILVFRFHVFRQKSHCRDVMEGNSRVGVKHAEMLEGLLSHLV